MTMVSIILYKNSFKVKVHMAGHALRIFRFGRENSYGRAVPWDYETTRTKAKSDAISCALSYLVRRGGGKVFVHRRDGSVAQVLELTLTRS